MAESPSSQGALGPQVSCEAGRGFCVFCFFFLILSLGVKCSGTRGGATDCPGPCPQTSSLRGEMLLAVASPAPCPAAVLQLPSPTPKTAGRGCRRGREPAQLLALAGSGEGCDMKEPGQTRVAEEPPPHLSPPPGGLLAALHIWATGAAAPGLWGEGRPSPPSPSWKGEVRWRLRRGEGEGPRGLPRGQCTCGNPRTLPVPPGNHRKGSFLLSRAGPRPGGRGLLKPFLGPLCPSFCWEVDDSCFYKARTAG